MPPPDDAEKLRKKLGTAHKDLWEAEVEGCNWSSAKDVRTRLSNLEVELTKRKALSTELAKSISDLRLAMKLGTLH